MLGDAIPPGLGGWRAGQIVTPLVPSEPVGELGRPAHITNEPEQLNGDAASHCVAAIPQVQGRARYKGTQNV